MEHLFIFLCLYLRKNSVVNDKLLKHIIFGIQCSSQSQRY